MSYQVQPIPLDSKPLFYSQFHCFSSCPPSPFSCISIPNQQCPLLPSSLYSFFPTAARIVIPIFSFNFFVVILKTCVDSLHSGVQILQHGIHSQGSALFTLSMSYALPQWFFNSFNYCPPRCLLRVLFFS